MVEKFTPISTYPRCEDVSANSFHLNDILDAEFYEELWTKSVVYFPGYTSRFTSLFGWNQLNHVLQVTHKLLLPPHINLLRNGSALLIDEYADTISDRKSNPFRQVSSEKVHALCRGGATLVLNGVERYWNPLQIMAGEVHKIFRERVQVNSFYSPSAIPALRTHFDTHDIFVLQVEGRKLWRIADKAFPYPLSTESSSAKTPPQGYYEEIELQQGDVLYLPRGVWHDAAATSNASLHLTIGIHSKTKYDFANWLSRRLAGDQQLRENLNDPMRKTDQQVVAETLKKAFIRELETVDILQIYEAAMLATRESGVVEFDFPK